MPLALVEKLRYDGRILFANRDANTKSGNPWHGAHGRFGFGPPGVKILGGVELLKRIGNPDRVKVDELAKAHEADGMSATVAEGGVVTVHLFAGGKEVAQHVTAGVTVGTRKAAVDAAELARRVAAVDAAAHELHDPTPESARVWLERSGRLKRALNDTEVQRFVDDVKARQGTSASAGKGITHPDRITQKHLETVGPQLDHAEAMRLHGILRGKGWSQKGIEERLHPHLREDVRARLTKTEVVPDNPWTAPPKPEGSSGRQAGGYSADDAFGTNTDLGRVGEDAFVRILGGEVLHGGGKGEQSPLDVRFDGLAFEVKAVSTKSQGYKATPKPFEVAQKEQFAKELGVKPALAIVVVDSRHGKAHAYYREGLQGGRLSEAKGWKYLGSTSIDTREERSKASAFVQKRQRDRLRERIANGDQAAVKQLKDLEDRMLRKRDTGDVTKRRIEEQRALRSRHTVALDKPVPHEETTVIPAGPHTIDLKNADDVDLRKVYEEYSLEEDVPTLMSFFGGGREGAQNQAAFFQELQRRFEANPELTGLRDDTMSLMEDLGVRVENAKFGIGYNSPNHGGESWNQTGEIFINPDAPDRRSMIAHELAHLLDFHIGPQPYSWLSNTFDDQEVKDFHEAVFASGHYQKLQEQYGNFADFLRYASSAPEVFARAFAQWVRYRNGDDQWQREWQFEWETQSPLARLQWDDAEFEPIARAMDALVEKHFGTTSLQFAELIEEVLGANA